VVYVSGAGQGAIYYLNGFEVVNEKVDVSLEEN
jgi:hypothetical protein